MLIQKCHELYNAKDNPVWHLRMESITKREPGIYYTLIKLLPTTTTTSTSTTTPRSKFGLGISINAYVCTQEQKQIRVAALVMTLLEGENVLGEDFITKTKRLDKDNRTLQRYTPRYRYTIRKPDTIPIGNIKGHWIYTL